MIIITTFAFSMKELQRIESVGNELIKRVCLLGQKSSERRKQRLFVVEGKRELIRCKQFDYEIVKVFICESFWIK